MSLFLSCGEASGDFYAAGLIRGLRGMGIELPAWGMVGAQAREAGVEELWNASSLGLVGVTEVLPSLLRLWRLKEEMARAVVGRNPDCVVVVDSPDFHLPFIRSIRKKGYGGPIVYVAPPTVWAWRRNRARVLRAEGVLCLPLFGFEHRLLQELGVRSCWEAHPLLETFRDFAPPKGLDSKLGGGPFATFLPGSRHSEVANLLDEMIRSAQGLKERGFTPVFSIARGLPDDLCESMRSRLADFKTYEGPARDIMSISDLVVGASGTVSVEALCLKKFMVVLYRMTPLSYAIAKMFVRVPFAAMPNILAGQEIYPEFLQRQARAENVIAAVDLHLQCPVAPRFLEGVERARAEMGQGSAYEVWGRAVEELMGS